MKTPSKRKLVALAFRPSEFRYLLGQTPFRIMLRAALKDDLERYEELCVVGELLLRKRCLPQPRGARHPLSESLPPKHSLGTETRELCVRAKKNIRAGRTLAAHTRLLISQTRGITERTYIKRKELGALLRELLFQREVERI